MSDTIIASFEREIMKYCKVPTITVYHKPKDYPNHFVARLYDMREPTKYIIVKDSVEELRELIPFGMIFFDRDQQDDEVIVETYIW